LAPAQLAQLSYLLLCQLGSGLGWLGSFLEPPHVGVVKKEKGKEKGPLFLFHFFVRLVFLSLLTQNSRVKKTACTISFSILSPSSAAAHLAFSPSSWVLLQLL
jgi:hypothetical protein